MKNTLSTLGHVLGSPMKGFAGEDYHAPRRILLILVLYLLWVAAALLTLQTQNTDTFKQIQYEVAMNSVEKRMAGATEDQMENTREAVRNQLNSPIQRIIAIISAVIFSGIIGILTILLTWAIIIILSRMLGGEETPLDEKKHRRTFYLCLYAAIPLAVSGLAAGILVITKNPDSYRNMLTMTDYMREMQITPSLYYVFRPTDFYPGLFLSYMFAILTDPFSWWGFIILYAGMKEILRLSSSKSVLIIAVSVLIMGGFTTLIQLPAQMMGG